jgi:formylglycine-generating enzyme required for sulfatase activity
VLLSWLERLGAMYRVLSLLFIPVFLGLWLLQRQVSTSVEASVENLSKKLEAETDARHSAEAENQRIAKKLEWALTKLDALEKQGAVFADQLGPSGNELIARVKIVSGVDLVAIPGQAEKEFFLMGSEQDDMDADNEEKRQHKVRISRSFYLGETKVTVSQFKRFADANPDFKTDAEKSKVEKTWRAPGFRQDDDHPVVCISWNDTKAYCDWLDFQVGGKGKVRLPSEAEWEYSCRAKSDKKYYFGDDATRLDEYAWFNGNSDGKSTRPVKKKKPNEFNLYDMHGLVWEWCHDSQRKYPEDHAIHADPVGLVGTQASRLLRGGSFANDKRNCRSAMRGVNVPLYTQDNVGFRVFVSR